MSEKKTNSNTKLNGSELYYGILLIVVLGIIPLIARLAIVDVNPAEYGVIRTAQTVNDVFSYNKTKLIYIDGVILLLSVAFSLLSREDIGIKLKRIPVILMGIVLLFALLSSLFSKYKGVSFMGAAERYEGFFIWLFYGVFFLMCMFYCNKEKKASFLSSIILFSAVIPALIGSCQAFGADIYTTKFMNDVIAGSIKLTSPIKIKFDSVFGTFYNPNCAGVYYGMTAAFATVTAVFSPLKSKVKYIGIPIAILLIISAIGTDSIGGVSGMFIGVFFSSVIGLIVFGKEKGKIPVTVIGIVMTVIALLAAVKFNPAIGAKMDVIVSALKGNTTAASSNFYEAVTVEGNKGIVKTKDGNFVVDYDGLNTSFYHNENKLTPVSSKQSDTKDNGLVYVFNESGIEWNLNLYDNIANIKAKDSLGNNTSFLFGEFDGELKFLDKFSQPVEPGTVEKFGFEGLERLGSNRGYIWSRSLPLFKKHILLGSGVDTFEFEFPQNDVYSKLEFLGTPYVIIDKPHNMYIQTAVNMGLIALLCQIALFMHYIFFTIKAVFTSQKNDGLRVLALSALSAAVVFITGVVTTDSVVSVSPVFWCILGAGYGADYLLLSSKQNRQEK